MSELLQCLEAFYARAGWAMVQVQGEPILSTLHEGTNGRWVIVAAAHDDTEVVTLFCRAPLTCPPDRLAETSAFIERFNFGLTHGAWVIDWRDGEIRFRVGIDCVTGVPADKLLQRATVLCVTAMDTLLPALRSVVEGGESAEAVFARLFPGEVGRGTE